MKKLFRWSGIVLSILILVGLSGCAGIFDKLKNPNEQAGDPSLNLKSLTIFDRDVKDYKITVENDISKIKAKNIKAIFDYGSKTNQELPVILTYKTGKSLQVGKNVLTLSVIAVQGKYQAWSKEITVTREESKDPKLTLSYLKVFDEEANDLNNLSFNVEHNVTTISSSNVVAKFNYGNKTDELIPVIFENGTLNEGSNTIKLSLEAVKGEYQAWSKDIVITRGEDPKLTLSYLKVFEEEASDLNSLSFNVDNNITSISSSNVVAKFNYGNKTDELISVMVENGTLNQGSNTIRLWVEGIDGKYKAWNKDIVITRGEDPKLTLSYLKVFDEEATDLNNLSFNVDNNITSISSSNVVAKFNYGNKTDELISVMVENRTLNEGSNTIRLSVEGVNGKYKAWNAVLSIKRMYRALTLKFLSVYIDRSMNIVWRGMNLTNSSLTVPNSTTEITSNMVHKSFEYYNGESAYPDLIVENGKLAVGKNIVKLSFPEFAGSEYYPAYQAWSMELTVIRNALPDNSLVPVTPPQEGIVGSAVKKEDFPFIGEYGGEYGKVENFQGVFIEGRTVILSPFNIAETETTYKLWKEVYDWATDEARGENKYTFANSGKKGGSWETIKPPPPPNEVSELEPVTKISWYDCVVWCNAYTEKTYGSDSECVYRKSDSDSTVVRDATKLIENYGDPYFDKTKKGFRLPTEAEWEYAARVQSDGTLCPLTYMSGAMGTCVATSNENEEAKINNIFAIHVAFCRLAFFGEYDKTSAVKCKAANALGLYDMSGNVYEICWDSRNYDSSVETGTVTDPALNSGYMVLRGGSFNSVFTVALVGAIRTCGHQRHTGDDAAVGFRVCQYR